MLVGIVIITFVVGLTVFMTRSSYQTSDVPFGQTIDGSSIFNYKSRYSVPFGQTIDGSSIFNYRAGYAADKNVANKKKRLVRKDLNELRTVMLEKIDTNRFYTANELIEILGDDYPRLLDYNLLTKRTNKYSPVDINNCIDSINHLYRQIVLSGDDSISSDTKNKILDSKIFKSALKSYYTKEDLEKEIGKDALEELIDLNYIINASSYPQEEIVALYDLVSRSSYMPMIQQNRIKTRNLDMLNDNPLA